MNAHATIAADLRGVCTTGFQAADLAAAKAWYTDVFGIEPYFDTPAYIEFRLGDDETEFGILDARYLPDLGGNQETGGAPKGAIVYWHVENVAGTIARLVEMGAVPHHPPRDFGQGFVGAAVIDPFGNILGLMNNPHYRDIKASRGA
ncbi:VOC family protein [Pelagibacterium xiamenense]|uniref:VOC family protein n=1 Tax=Pelagibacterium xiamenense TaxID=2901140 RepID=UPI001E41E641|nr:VOC family protein [Pelagibacterium xiamenense]MCD7059472.1 hypothetical protein [Pelagibacterium xiamenense]